MMAPRSRNKREWQSGEVAVLDFALPMTLGGRLYAEIVLKRLAPALRDAFLCAPRAAPLGARGTGAQDVSAGGSVPMRDQAQHCRSPTMPAARGNTGQHGWAGICRRRRVPRSRSISSVGRARRHRRGVAGARKRSRMPSAVFQSFAHVRIWARHFIGREQAALRCTSRSCAKAAAPVLILPLAISGPRFLAHRAHRRRSGRAICGRARSIRRAHRAAPSRRRSPALRAAGVDAIVLRGLRDDCRIFSGSPRPIFGRRSSRTVAPYRRSFRLRRLSRPF